MGNKREEENEHHPAVDNLVSLFTKANHGLSLLQFKLGKEFQQIYPDNANPMKLVARIKKIQDELLSMKDQCRQLLAAKQDLIDEASSILVGNRSMVQRMQASVGIPVTSDSEDAAFSSFKQIIEEWTTHVRSRTGWRTGDILFEVFRSQKYPFHTLQKRQRTQHITTLEMKGMMLCQRILTICCLRQLLEAHNGPFIAHCLLWWWKEQ